MLEDPKEAQELFEREVRRIAEHLWPSAAGGVSAVSGRERDGVYYTSDAVYCVEATVSSRHDKAEKDLDKIALLLEEFLSRFPERLVRGFWITKNPITKHQLDVHARIIGKHRMLRPADIVCEDFDKFRRRLFDLSGYIQCRDTAAFGSVADPSGDAGQYEGNYIALDIVESSTGSVLRIKDIANGILQGDRFLVLGDYGAGKSMTLREIFRKGRQPALKGERNEFPVAINLREHHGQASPREALMRHADSIAFPPRDLVSAWQAGYAMILLDGFDELGTGRAIGSPKRVREARRDAVQLVRNFVRESPSKTGIVIAGRSFYFDDAVERDELLGTGQRFRVLTLNEFTEEQVAKYLSKHKIFGSMPDWLPSRPLLLGYLAAGGLLNEVVSIGKDAVPGIAWDQLLGRICEREADQQKGMSPEEVRELIEKVATRCRCMREGIGPIEQELLWDVFEEVVLRKPDERDLVQLNRLPGLGSMSTSEARTHSHVGRYFVDEDLADTARAGDVVRVISSGRISDKLKNCKANDWLHSLGDLGVSVAANQLRRLGMKSKSFGHLLATAASSQCPQLAYDVIRIGSDYKDLDLPEIITVSDGEFDTIDLTEFDDVNLSKLEFRSCWIDRVVVSDETARNRPVFYDCMIEVVQGPPVSSEDRGKYYPKCEIGRIDRLEMTTQSLLELNLPVGPRVLLTMLKKLYRQRGRGRQESAFVRGLSNDDRKYVREVMKLVLKHGLAFVAQGGAGSVWLPVRSARSRVNHMLAHPNDSADQSIVDARRIG